MIRLSTLLVLKIWDKFQKFYFHEEARPKQKIELNIEKFET